MPQLSPPRARQVRRRATIERSTRRRRRPVTRPGSSTPQALESIDALRRRAQARGAHLSFAVQVGALVVSYALQAVLAHALGRRGFGIYSNVLAWTGPLTLLSGLGLSTVALQLVPVYRDKADHRRLVGLIRASERIALISAIVVAALGSVIALSTLHDPAPVLVGLWALPLGVQVRIQGELARSAERFRLAFLLPLLQQLAMLAGGLALLNLVPGRTPALALTLPALGSLVALPIQRVALRRSLRAERAGKTAPPALYELRPWIRRGLTFLAIDTAETVLGMADTLLVGALLGPRELALYAVANSTAIFAMFPMIAVGATTVPSFARAWESADKASLNEIAQRAVRWAFWPQLALSALLVAFAPPLLALFGPSYPAARPALIFLLCGQLANTATGYIGCLMKLAGDQRATMRSIAGAALANVAFVLVGVHVDGITGAAAGSAAAALGWNLWLYGLVRRHIGVYPAIVDVLIGRSPRTAAV